MRATHICLAALLSASLLVPAAALAFTIENGGGSRGGAGAAAVPQFDLEEQARSFRTPSFDTSSPKGHEFQTPFGKGTFHFGMQPGLSPFTSDFRAQQDRRHYERMLAPPGLQHRFD